MLWLKKIFGRGPTVEEMTRTSVTSTIHVDAKPGDLGIRINGKEVHLPAAFTMQIEVDGVCVVLVDGEKNNRNILAYNATGDLLWTVEEPSFLEPLPGFKYIKPSRESIIGAARMDRFVIDIHSGKIVDRYR